MLHRWCYANERDVLLGLFSYLWAEISMKSHRRIRFFSHSVKMIKVDPVTTVNPQITHPVILYWKKKLCLYKGWLRLTPLSVTSIFPRWLQAYRVTQWKQLRLFDWCETFFLMFQGISLPISYTQTLPVSPSVSASVWPPCRPSLSPNTEPVKTGPQACCPTPAFILPLLRREVSTSRKYTFYFLRKFRSVSVSLIQTPAGFLTASPLRADV